MREMSLKRTWSKAPQQCCRCQKTIPARTAALKCTTTIVTYTCENCEKKAIHKELHPTYFDKITASPEALGAFLASLPTLSGPWDDAFHRKFCDTCEAENCDAENCHHSAERDNPTWWLKQEVNDVGNGIVGGRPGTPADAAGR